MIFEKIEVKYYNQGLELAKSASLTKAVEVLEKAVNFNPFFVEAWNVLGLCFYQLGEFSFAKSVWQKSAEILKAEENIAAFYLEELKEKEFCEFCTQYNKALFLAQKGEFKEAATILSSFNMNFSQTIASKNALALCKFGENKKVEALQIWKSVLKMDRENPMVLQYLKEDWGNIVEEKTLFQRIKDWFVKGE